MKSVSFPSLASGTFGRKQCFVPFVLVLSLVAALAMTTDIAYAKKDKNHQEQTYGGYVGPQGNAPSLGGYTGPKPSLVTVEQALSMDDEAWVTLKGTITQSLGGKEYMFADSTGAAEVKIGHKVWMGQYVNASDTVEIHGKVKKNWTRTRIDVKGLTKQ